MTERSSLQKIDMPDLIDEFARKPQKYLFGKKHTDYSYRSHFHVWKKGTMESESIKWGFAAIVVIDWFIVSCDSANVVKEPSGNKETNCQWILQKMKTQWQNNWLI